MKNKNKKAKTNVSYYLRINGDIIVDWDMILGLEDMKDYLRLNLLTGYFKDRDGLVEFITKLGIVPKGENVASIEIVRKVGNKDVGYNYKYITRHLTYARDVKFLSNQTLKDFFIKNRENAELMHELVDNYIDGLEKKVNNKTALVNHIKRALETCASDKEASELQEELNSELNSLKKFTQELTTLSIIQGAVGKLEKGEILDHKTHLDYIARIGDFVDNETKYYRKDTVTVNKLGLVKMGKFASILSKNYEALLPSAFAEFREVKRELDEAILPVLATSKKVRSFLEIDESVDPDEYMFLTEEDYDRLLKSQEDGELGRETPPSQEVIESVETDKEILEQRQKRF